MTEDLRRCSLFAFLRRWLLPLSIENHERCVERIVERDRREYERRQGEYSRAMQAWRRK
jgi:hypothetical protein